MTDALRDAEAAARVDVTVTNSVANTPLSAWTTDDFEAFLDAYRDAIEKRVREEREGFIRDQAQLFPSTMRELVGAAFESYGALLALVGQEHPSAVRLFAALKAFRDTQP
jgi:hypothetical protein